MNCLRLRVLLTRTTHTSSRSISHFPFHHRPGKAVVSLYCSSSRPYTMALAEPVQTRGVKQPIQKKWWKESSVYQIYPASFKDSNGDGLGDIPGITSELDYIKGLGVDIVWLSPILDSPQVDMGYDISDYKQIYAPYGTMADHDAMIKGMHDRGMKYVMDLVVNHTSEDHAWFKESRSSKDNPKRDWYIWRPAKYNDKGDRIPPNNWESAFSNSVWEWDEHTQEYYLHIFATAQPDLNWENPEVVEAVHDIIRFWLERGVDGFRMDVINFISKEPGLPDGPITRPGQFLQMGIKWFACGPRLHEFLQGIGKILEEYDAFSVGEMPGVTDPKEIVKGVGQDRNELGMAFQFEIVNLDSNGPKWEPQKFLPKSLKKIVYKWQHFMLNNAGWNALYMENHDQSRTVSRYCSDTPTYRTISAKMIAAHLALQSGTVFIYQGQELAQKNIPESWGLDKYKDIECLNHWATVLRDYPDDKEKQAMYKRQYRLIGRDNARTPMQWSAANKFAGFTSDEAIAKGVEPWMSIHEDYETWNAEKIVADRDSSYNYLRSILDLRKQEKNVFVYGDFEMLDMDHEYVIPFVRKMDSDPSSAGSGDGKTQALVVANFAGEEECEHGKDGLWWKVPEGHERFVTQKGAILDQFRNYKTPNEVKEEGGSVYIKLRPYEIVVAMV